MDFEEFFNRCQKEIDMGVGKRDLKYLAEFTDTQGQLFNALKDFYNAFHEKIDENFDKYKGIISKLIHFGVDSEFYYTKWEKMSKR